MKRTLITLFILSVPAMLYAWTGPTAAPPGNNISAPVNMSSTDQFKPAVLGADILNILGANQYLNFGNTTGSAGFGFRNNGGIVEYKQTGGNNTAAGWHEVGKGRGSVMKITIGICPSGCTSYHALNTWINVASYGYAWTTSLNTDSSTFTHNGTGLITISKAGVYRIRIGTMFIPSTDAAYIYGCPILSGSANCGLGAPEGLRHSYHPAGWWGQNINTFVFDLAAGATVGYGYYTPYTLSYWANNGYTFVEVTRVN